MSVNYHFALSDQQVGMGVMGTVLDALLSS